MRMEKGSVSSVALATNGGDLLQVPSKNEGMCPPLQSAEMNDSKLRHDVCTNDEQAAACPHGFHASFSHTPAVSSQNNKLTEGKASTRRKRNRKPNSSRSEQKPAENGLNNSIHAATVCKHDRGADSDTSFHVHVYQHGNYGKPYAAGQTEDSSSQSLSMLSTIPVNECQSADQTFHPAVHPDMPVNGLNTGLSAAANDSPHLCNGQLAGDDLLPSSASFHSAAMPGSHQFVPINPQTDPGLLTPPLMSPRKS